MFKEIAIDPEVMARWEWFLKIYDMFGFDEGRLLAEFPRSWKKDVIQRAKELIAEGVNQDVKVSSLIARITSDEFKDRLFTSGREPDKKQATWLGMAMKQSPPFDAIVAETPTDSALEVIPAEYEVDGTCFSFWEDARFRVKRQRRIPRKADDLIGAAAKLLKKANAIRYVDPYFNPKLPEKRDPFVRLVDFLYEYSCPAKKIEVFCRLIPKKGRPREFRAKPEDFRKLDPELPTGMAATFYFLEEFREGENLHPRFLLTNRGGLQYDYGLDGGKGTTIVTILDRDLRDQLWEEYSPNTSTFAHHPDCPWIELGG